jgi:hypothetical protein
MRSLTLLQPQIFKRLFSCPPSRISQTVVFTRSTEMESQSRYARNCGFPHDKIVPAKVLVTSSEAPNL